MRHPATDFVIVTGAIFWHEQQIQVGEYFFLFQRSTGSRLRVVDLDDVRRVSGDGGGHLPHRLARPKEDSGHLRSLLRNLHPRRHVLRLRQDAAGTDLDHLDHHDHSVDPQIKLKWINLLNGVTERKTQKLNQSSQLKFARVRQFHLTQN